jgi:hypothetical protein
VRVEEYNNLDPYFDIWRSGAWRSTNNHAIVTFAVSLHGFNGTRA